jgi:hypothetical protein
VLIVVAVVLLGYGLLDGSNTYLAASILTSLAAALALVIGSRRSGRAAVAAAAVEAEEVVRNRRRTRQEEVARRDELVGAGVGGTGAGMAGGGDRAERGMDRDTDRIPAASDEYSDRDDLARRTHDTALLDLGRRQAPAQSTGYDDEADGYRADSYGEPTVEVYDNDEDDDEEEFEDPADEPPAQRISSADSARVALLDADVLVIDGRPRYHLPGCVHLLGREHESLPVSEAAELGFTPCGLCEPDSALLARARRG